MHNLTEQLKEEKKKMQWNKGIILLTNISTREQNLTFFGKDIKPVKLKLKEK